MTESKKKAQSIRKHRSAIKRGVIKNGAPQRPSHLVILINDTLWLLVFAILSYYILSLLTFRMTDPAWSRGNPDLGLTQNLGGSMGAHISDISYYVFGFSSWWIVAAGIVWLYHNFSPLGKDLIERKKPYDLFLGGMGLLLLLLFSPLLERLLWPTQFRDILPIGSGGLIGRLSASGLVHLFGLTGSLLLVSILVILSISLLIQVSWVVLLEKIGTRIERLWYTITGRGNYPIESPEIKETRRMVRKAQEINQINLETPEGINSNRKPVTVHTSPPEIQRDLFDNTANISSPLEQHHTQQESVRLPEISLLNTSQKRKLQIDTEQLQSTAECIEQKLKEFGIKTEVTSATTGPVITRYEINPAQGVKGSQIVALGKDLARAMAVQSIRVVETIAGKSTMGIEIPNAERQTVLISEVIGTKVFKESPSKLTMAMGKDITGIPVIADLQKMPHVLVAGATKSGKSVGINSMIASILYKAQPSEVRFIMIDPKVIELSIYEGIPHLLCPVVTDMEQAIHALNWCIIEMERRYRLLSHVGVRNHEDFNQAIQAAHDNHTPIYNPFSANPDNPQPLETLPFIVLVIDELADLMQTVGKKVEKPIARLAQKARAAGIHLILATQRPSVDVITGLIKANIPTRIAFQVSSKVDSRTILDQMGAENLLGQGDMLFLPPGQPEPTRVHGTLITTEETQRIVDFIKRQTPTQYIEGILSGEAATETENKIHPNANSDELFDEAVAFILETRKTSISSLQRHLRIGYNRAANLMDAMEEAGIVSPPELGGSRRIFAKKH